MFIKSNTSDNLFFLVVGDAGCGKTYMLNQIRNNISSLFSSILLNFSGNTEKDYLLCYKLFIFCQFGSLWELKIEDFQFLNLDFVVKNVLKEINDGITSKIRLSQIYYIESLRHQIIIHSINGEMIERKTLSQFIKEIQSLDFIQIHKSYVVNKQFIQEVKNQEVILKEQTHLPIGRSYKESLKEQN